MRTKVIYEDKDIIVAQKPAGLATQTARVGQADMVSELKNHIAPAQGGKSPYLGVIHRLDQPVEGPLVFAKNQKAAAVLTKQLLINIFEKNTPLHDGAIIVRGDRIVAATCYLPLSENMSLNKALGTRHRAAIGISEVCDALTIVVSEETGRVSIAENGKLTEGVTDEQLRAKLIELQNPEKEPEENSKPRLGRRGKNETKHNS